jgi:hypothetical protein
MDAERRGRIFFGAVLIIVGIGLLALQYVEGFGDAMILFLIGVLLVAGYFHRRSYGLLIPGCLLLGIGLGKVGESSLLAFGGFEQLGLGMGFVAIYVIDLVYTSSSSWWPLIPGLILIVVGLSEGSEDFRRLVSVGWPIILVFFGLLLLAGAFGFTGRKKGEGVLEVEEPEQEEA